MFDVAGSKMSLSTVQFLCRTSISIKMHLNVIIELHLNVGREDRSTTHLF